MFEDIVTVIVEVGADSASEGKLDGFACASVVIGDGFIVMARIENLGLVDIEVSFDIAVDPNIAHLTDGAELSPSELVQNVVVLV